MGRDERWRCSRRDRSWGFWQVLGRVAPGERLCAGHALSTDTHRAAHGRTHGDYKGYVPRARGRHGLPEGEDEVLVDGVRCEDCLHYWELDATAPERRLVTDDGLTRPTGAPWEARPGTAA